MNEESWYLSAVSRKKQEALRILAHSAGVRVYSFRDNAEYKIPCFRNGNLLLFNGPALLVGKEISYEQAINFFKKKIKERQI